MFTTTMHRAFVSSEIINTAALDKETVHRFARVLRLQPGEQVELFDGTGRLLQGMWTEQGTLESIHRLQAPTPKHHLVLWQALVSMDKLETIVQHATELGVSEVRIFHAERSQVDFKDKLEAKLLRLTRIAQDASRQSGRAYVPVITYCHSGLDPESMDPGSKAGVTAMRFVCHPTATQGFPKTLANHRQIELVVGPEGGFSEQEVARLVEQGGKLVHLGEHVLRTETAGLAALAQIQGVLCEALKTST